MAYRLPGIEEPPDPLQQVASSRFNINMDEEEETQSVEGTNEEGGEKKEEESPNK